LIPDDTSLTFGTSKDTKIRYDEATDDRLEVTGADWNFANGVAISISDTTQSTTTSTGALIVTGGVGIGSRLNVVGDVDFDGDLNIDGGDVTTNQSTFNLLNQNATNITAFYAASSIGIGSISNTSTVTVRSTQNTSSTSTGALVVSGGVGISSDLRIGGDLYSTGSQTITNNLNINGNSNLGNGPTDQVTIVGNVYHTGVSTNIGGIFVDAVGISSNIIQIRPGTGDKLFIDPYPDGLSNEGTVIIKG
jgi:hypothetical protein